MQHVLAIEPIRDLTIAINLVTFLAVKLMHHVIAIGSLSTRLTIAINLVTFLALKLMQHVIAIGSRSTRLTIAINLVTKVDATCNIYWFNKKS
jgi:hypothetical protein